MIITDKKEEIKNLLEARNKKSREIDAFNRKIIDEQEKLKAERQAEIEAYLQQTKQISAEAKISKRRLHWWAKGRNK